MSNIGRLACLVLSSTVFANGIAHAASMLPVPESASQAIGLQTQFRIDPSQYLQGSTNPESADNEKILSKTKRAFHLGKDLDIASLNEQLAIKAITLYAKPIKTAPVFYRSDISAIFGGGTGTGGLLVDDSDQVDPLEFVALHGTVLKVEAIVKDGANYVARVTTPDYPYTPDEGKAYYVDARMLRFYWAPYGKLDIQYASEKAAMPYPSESAILDRMRFLSGSLYVWGGNDPNGITSLEKYYTPTTAISGEARKKWILQGVDCSGLLYYATDGMTPRNTSSLVSFGTGLAVAGKTADEIASMLKPLDLIAWKGHTLIVLDGSQVIESNWSMGGVRISDLKTRLVEIMQDHAALNDIDDVLPQGMTKKFVVRRWHPAK